MTSDDGCLRHGTCTRAVPLVPKQLIVESWLGFGHPEEVGGPSAAHLHSQARFLVCTLRGSSCVSVVGLGFCRAFDTLVKVGGCALAADRDLERVVLAASSV